jgi:hypothetical protein
MVLEMIETMFEDLDIFTILVIESCGSLLPFEIKEQVFAIFDLFPILTG